jgi:hypothetical protein
MGAAGVGDEEFDFAPFTGSWRGVSPEGDERRAVEGVYTWDGGPGR